MSARKVKIIVIGDSAVGKTALVRKWLHLDYPITQQSPTYGAGCLENEVYVNEKMQKVQVWDTAGEEKYRSMAPIYGRGACGVLIVFDVTNRSSFENINEWISSIDSIGSVPIVIIGNKVDLPNRVVTREEAENFCKEHSNGDIQYSESSAETGFGVDDSFMKLLEVAVPDEVTPASVLVQPASSRSVKKEEEIENAKKKCCN